MTSIAARPFEIGLRRYGPAIYQDGIVLKILPLRRRCACLSHDRSELKFNADHTALTLARIIHSPP